MELEQVLLKYAGTGETLGRSFGPHQPYSASGIGFWAFLGYLANIGVLQGNGVREVHNGVNP